MFSNNQKRYAVLSSDLMKLYGEICGYYDLNDQIYNLLAEDATFRLNEILNQSNNLKRRINKDKLDVNHINLMLKCYNVKSIDGHETTDKNKIRSIFNDKEEPINLFNESTKLINQKQSIRKRSIKLNSEYVKLKYDESNLESIEYSQLDDKLKKYFNFIIKHLFTLDNKLINKIHKDLRINQQLGDLCSYLINYFKLNLDDILINEFKSIRLLDTIECLIKNEYLDFKLQNSLIKLIDLLLDCLLDNKLKHENDFLYKFRYSSAKLLNLIIFKFYQVINLNGQLIKIIDLLLKQFINTINLDIKYGIMIFYQNLNPFIFFDILFPSLIEFIEQLELKRNNKTINKEDNFFNSILLILVNCFNYIINSDKILNSNEFNIKQYYSKIYEIYGDSFNNLISCNDSNFIKIKFINQDNL